MTSSNDKFKRIGREMYEQVIERLSHNGFGPVAEFLKEVKKEVEADFLSQPYFNPHSSVPDEVLKSIFQQNKKEKEQETFLRILHSVVVSDPATGISLDNWVTMLPAYLVKPEDLLTYTDKGHIEGANGVADANDQSVQERARRAFSYAETLHELFINKFHKE